MFVYQKLWKILLQRNLKLTLLFDLLFPKLFDCGTFYQIIEISQNLSFLEYNLENTTLEYFIFDGDAFLYTHHHMYVFLSL